MARRTMAAAAAAVTVAVAAISRLSAQFGRPEMTTSFALPAAGAPTSLHGRPSLPGLAGSAASVAARTAVEAPSANNFTSAFAAAGLVLLAGAAVLRRRQAARQRGARVGMNARGSNPFRPAAKGKLPMIHRPVTRNIVKHCLDYWVKKKKNISEVEDIMKKYLHGRAQFQFASEHFTDQIPLWPVSRDARPTNRNESKDHIYDDAFYVRKFLEPAKFKKLEIVNWEMPEGYTKVCTLSELVQAGMQYGHTANTWNPKMLQYLYSESDGTHIFDLVQTAACLNRACYYAMEAASKGATFIWSGTKEQAGPLIKQAGLRTGMPYADIKFTGGLLTNFNLVQKSIAKMKRLRMEREQGAWKMVNRAQALKNELCCNRLVRKLTGVEHLTKLPDIMIVVDEVKERNTVLEARRIGMPVIGMIDSNNDPTSVDLPIPGNASGSRAITLVVEKLTQAILKGQQLREQEGADREVFEPAWDPWLFSKDRLRKFQRRSKRQPWHKQLFGGYEQWKQANPFGNIPTMEKFTKFTWRD